VSLRRETAAAGNEGVGHGIHLTTQKSIRVLIARDNPKKYWMDVSFLPKDSSGRG
jgi:hypothetical protein